MEVTMNAGTVCPFDIAHANDLEQWYHANWDELSRFGIGGYLCTALRRKVEVCVYHPTTNGYAQRVYHFDLISNACTIRMRGTVQAVCSQRGIVLLLQYLEGRCADLIERRIYSDDLCVLAHRLFLTHTRLQSEIYTNAA